MFESIATAPNDSDEDEPKSPRRKLLLVLLPLLVSLGILAGFLFLPYFRARSLLADVRSLQVGKSTFDDARQIAEKWGKLPPACTAQDCSWFKWIDNSRLPAWYRGDGEIFAAGFHVSHGIVDGRNFGYWIGTGPNAPSASVDEQLHWKQASLDYFYGKTYMLAIQSTPAMPNYRVFVRFQAEAPPGIRSKYLAFRLNCLWLYHGCRDARQLLPTADWQ